MPRTKTLPSNGATQTASPPAMSVIIRPLHELSMGFRLHGEAPYMQCRFSQKAIAKIQETHRQGQQARSKRIREARDFDDDYEQAKHKFADRQLWHSMLGLS